MSREAAHIALYGLLGPVSVLTLLAVLFRLRAGAGIWQEQRSRIGALEGQLQPRIALSVAVRRLLGGHAHESPFTGSRTTVERLQTHVIEVHCQNIGRKRLGGCEAHIIGARAVEPDGTTSDIGFSESVKLSWSRNLDQPTFTQTLAQGVSVPVLVLHKVRSGVHLFRSRRELPLEYTNLFDGTRRFRLWVRVSGPETDAEIAFDFWLAADALHAEVS